MSKKQAFDFASPKQIEREFRVPAGNRVRIKDYDPGFRGDWTGDDDNQKSFAKKLLKRGIAELAEAQDRLYADDSWSLLVVFQAMDAAGKDGTIKHVMSGINPQGCQVFSFKHPSAEELDHNYLWRYSRGLPERGRIGIFNRSHYEEVLVVRVHPELLRAQRIPNIKPSGKLWEQRYEEINGFEKHLSSNGTRIVKFFLNVSRDEQRRRFLDRIDDPTKNWKFSAADIVERGYWNDYMKAYEDAISATSTEWAPWYIIPADHKWVTRLCVSAILVETMKELKLRYQSISKEQRLELARSRKLLKKEKS